jgi:hypothetical protein
MKAIQEKKATHSSNETSSLRQFKTNKFKTAHSSRYGKDLTFDGAILNLGVSKTWGKANQK